MFANHFIELIALTTIAYSCVAPSCFSRLDQRAVVDNGKRSGKIDITQL